MGAGGDAQLAEMALAETGAGGDAQLAETALAKIPHWRKYPTGGKWRWRKRPTGGNGAVAEMTRWRNWLGGGDCSTVEPPALVELPLGENAALVETPPRWNAAWATWRTGEPAS